MLTSISSANLFTASRFERADEKENLESKPEKTTLESEARKLSQNAQKELTQQEQVEIQQLKQRDQEVKAHEQAHLSAAGSLAIGGPRYTYTTGPNGIRYATGGEVSIDTSAIPGDPEANIRKADAIRRAALAPAEPSSQDRRVASQATTLESKARIELVKMEQKAKAEAAKEEAKQDKKEVEQSSGNQANESDNSTDDTQNNSIDLVV